MILAFPGEDLSFSVIFPERCWHKLQMSQFPAQLITAKNGNH